MMMRCMFQAKHIGMLASFDRECDRLDSQKRVHKLDDDTSADPGSSHQTAKKQCTISQIKPLTQSLADEYILDYIVDSVLPIHHVDTPPFEQFVRNLTGGHIATRCRQTVTAQLEGSNNAKQIYETICRKLAQFAQQQIAGPPAGAAF